MKAPALKSKRCAASRSSISRSRGHALFMYTVRQQTNHTAGRRVDAPGGVSRHALQRVGSEAARLACFSRHRVVSRREILDALSRMRRRRIPDALAGG